MRSGQPKQPFPPHEFSFGPNCRTKSKRKRIRHNIISKTALARIAHDSRVHLVTFWNPTEQSRPHFSNHPVQRPQPSLMSGRFKRTQSDGSLRGKWQLKLCSPCGLLSLALLYLAVLAAAPPLRFRASDVRGDVRDPVWDFGVIVLWLQGQKGRSYNVIRAASSIPAVYSGRPRADSMIATVHRLITIKPADCFFFFPVIISLRQCLWWQRDCISTQLSSEQIKRVGGFTLWERSWNYPDCRLLPLRCPFNLFYLLLS